MLAIDAVFAIRMVHDIALPPVPLIVLFDVAGWKFDNDVERCLASMRSMLRLPEETSGTVIEALHYMQALEWVSSIAKPGFEATLETVVRLNGDTCSSASTPTSAPTASGRPTCRTRKARCRLRSPAR